MRRTNFCWHALMRTQIGFTRAVCLIFSVKHILDPFADHYAALKEFFFQKAYLKSVNRSILIAQEVQCQPFVLNALYLYLICIKMHEIYSRCYLLKRFASSPPSTGINARAIAAINSSKPRGTVSNIGLRKGT